MTFYIKNQTWFIFLLLIPFQIAAQNPSAKDQIQKGDSAFAEGNFEVAKSYYNQALKSDSSLSIAVLKRAGSNICLRNLSKAEQDIETLEARAWRLDTVYYRKAIIKAMQGKERESLNAIRKSEKIKKTPHAQLMKVKLYYNLDEYKKAIKESDKLIEDFGYEPEFGSWRGKALLINKNYDKAIGAFTKLIEIEPENEKNYIMRSEAYFNKGKHEKAYNDLKMATKLDPENSLANNNFAFLLMEMERYDEAKDIYKKIIKDSPENSYTLNNLGYALLQTGKIKEAEESIVKSIDINPDNSYAYRNLSLVYREKGELNKACKEAKKAIEKGFSEMYGTEMEEFISNNCQ